MRWKYFSSVTEFLQYQRSKYIKFGCGNTFGNLSSCTPLTSESTIHHDQHDYAIRRLNDPALAPDMNYDFHYLIGVKFTRV